MNHSDLREEQKEALWEKAQAVGMPRRKFLILLAGRGAAAVLAACTPKKTPAPTPAPTPSPAPARLVDKPVPEQFFFPIGGANNEMCFEVMANRTYAMPNSFFFVRNHTSTPVIDIKTWTLSIEGDGVATPLTLTYDDLLKPRLQEVKAQHDRLLARKAELDMMLSQRKIELASLEVVREYVDDLRQFLDSSDLPERRAFIKGFIKEVHVTGDEGKIRYTFPIPPDNLEEEKLEVLPIVRYSGQ